MFKVDSGASLRIVGLSSLTNKEKNTIRQSRKNLDIQTTTGIVVSDTQTIIYMKELGAYQWLSSSPKNGRIISSNTGNPQGELMENRFNSDSAYFLVLERT